MKCYYHVDREAVATCPNCGKNLCQECASHYTPCFCDDCVRQDRKQTAAKDARTFLICSIIGGICLAVELVIAIVNKAPLGILVGLIEFCIPFGYKTVRDWIMSKSIIISVFVLAGICWFVGFALGPFCFVYWVIRMIRNARNVPDEPVSAAVASVAGKVGRAGKKAAQTAKEKAREAYENHNAQRAARAELPAETEIPYDLEVEVSTPEVNLSKCIKPRIEAVDGDNKLRLDVNTAALMAQLPDAKERFGSKAAALRDFIESIRPRASKTEYFQSGDVVNISIDYDWELAEELGLHVIGTRFRMTAK